MDRQQRATHIREALTRHGLDDPLVRGSDSSARLAKVEADLDKLGITVPRGTLYRHLKALREGKAVGTVRRRDTGVPKSLSAEATGLIREHLEREPEASAAAVHRAVSEALPKEDVKYHVVLRYVNRLREAEEADGVDVDEPANGVGSYDPDEPHLPPGLSALIDAMDAPVKGTEVKELLGFVDPADTTRGADAAWKWPAHVWFRRLVELRGDDS